MPSLISLWFAALNLYFKARRFHDYSGDSDFLRIADELRKFANLVAEVIKLQAWFEQQIY